MPALQVISLILCSSIPHPFLKKGKGNNDGNDKYVSIFRSFYFLSELGEESFQEAVLYTLLLQEHFANIGSVGILPGHFQTSFINCIFQTGLFNLIFFANQLLLMCLTFLSL